MRWFLLVAMLMVASVAEAQVGPVCKKTTCKVMFTEPQTNTDGSNLNDLREYRIYVATSVANLAAMATPTFVVPAANPDPVAGGVVTFTGIRNLAVGQWFMQVSAADISGNEGGRTASAPFFLQDDVSPSLPGIPVISD